MNAPSAVIVTFPGAQILDVTGPLEVFSTISRLLPESRHRLCGSPRRAGDRGMAG